MSLVLLHQPTKAFQSSGPDHPHRAHGSAELARDLIEWHMFEGAQNEDLAIIGRQLADSVGQ
jgi:hypothetical protein